MEFEVGFKETIVFLRISLSFGYGSERATKLLLPISSLPIQVFSILIFIVGELTKCGAELTTCVVMRYWKYGGSKVVVAKERIIVKDDKNRSIAFNVIEGDVLNVYKSFTVKVQVTTKCGGALVKWSIEFEKANEDVPNPDAYADLLDKVTKTLDGYLLQKA